MKKFLSVLLAITTIFTFCFFAVGSGNKEMNDGLKENLKEGVGQIADEIGNGASVQIIDSSSGYEVDGPVLHPWYEIRCNLANITYNSGGECTDVYNELYGCPYEANDGYKIMHLEISFKSNSGYFSFNSDEFTCYADGEVYYSIDYVSAGHSEGDQSPETIEMYFMVPEDAEEIYVEYELSGYGTMQFDLGAW